MFDHTVNPYTPEEILKLARDRNVRWLIVKQDLQNEEEQVEQERDRLTEALEQEFLVKDPTRTLKIPKNLRPKDKQILTWEQMRAILEKAARRDRLILMLDITDALRPSELFALRWQSFDDANTLSLTETVYRDSKTELSGAPPHEGAPGTESGIGEGHPVSPEILANRHDSERRFTRCSRRQQRSYDFHRVNLATIDDTITYKTSAAS